MLEMILYLICFISTEITDILKQQLVLVALHSGQCIQSLHSILFTVSAGIPSSWLALSACGSENKDVVLQSFHVTTTFPALISLTAQLDGEVLFP